MIKQRKISAFSKNTVLLARSFWHFRENAWLDLFGTVLAKAKDKKLKL